MATEIKIPQIGESITEVTLTTWHKSDGDYVEMGENLCEIESDKASMDLPAEVSGVLKISTEEGEEVAVGGVIGTIDESASAGASAPAKEPEKEEAKEEPVATSAPASNKEVQHASPAASKILAEKGVDAKDVQGSGRDGRVTKADAQAAAAPKASSPAPAQKPDEPKVSLPQGERAVSREKMSRLRKTIAKRLVEAKNTTAMLTTFNEVDMYEVMELRKRYKEPFKEKYGVGLGFMSLFTKACTLAAEKFPAVNGQIDGEEIVLHNYVDMGIAVSTPKGLVVPVVRNAESMALHQIEAEILRLATKGRDGKLSVDEMSGGTFTITNGGVFGSMLSTPLLNIPQCAILGMHNIVQRPWVVNGEVKIRPIMYVALSYDHRLVDGRESVGFLKSVKEYLEDPARLVLQV